MVPYIAEKTLGGTDDADRATGGASFSESGGGAKKKTTRRWFDGSLEQDLPMRGLSEMFNVNYFLVSQVRNSASMLCGAVR